MKCPKKVDGNKKNIYRVYEACLVLSRETSVSEYYFVLRSTLNDLAIHQILVIDFKTLRQCHQDLALAKFLSVLDPSLHLY